MKYGIRTLLTLALGFAVIYGLNAWLIVAADANLWEVVNR